MKKIITLVGALLLSSVALACDNHLEVSNVWARSSSAPNNNSAAYMTIENTSKEPIEITGVETDVAGKVELHETFLDEKGVHKMSHVDKIVVPAGSTIKMEPQHTHIMLMDLKRDLKSGEKFQLKLKIGKDSEKELEVEVRQLGK